jgi:hypothetical protein
MNQKSGRRNKKLDYRYKYQDFNFNLDTQQNFVATDVETELIRSLNLCISRSKQLY